MSRLRFLLSTFAVAASLVAGATGAKAHDANRFVIRYAPADAPFYTVEVFPDKRMPGGATRARMQDGAGVWNDRGRQVVYNVHRRAVEGNGAQNCPALDADNTPRAILYWQTIDGAGTTKRDTLGQTFVCQYNQGNHAGRISGFTQVYDSKQPNWYRGTGGAPSDRYDLWSVVVHEFGHATGWRTSHYGADNKTNVCAASNRDRESMCPLIIQGQERVRTLGRHDRHTFGRVYAQR